MAHADMFPEVENLALQEFANGMPRRLIQQSASMNLESQLKRDPLGENGRNSLGSDGSREIPFELACPFRQPASAHRGLSHSFEESLSPLLGALGEFHGTISGPACLHASAADMASCALNELSCLIVDRSQWPVHADQGPPRGRGIPAPRSAIWSSFNVDGPLDPKNREGCAAEGVNRRHRPQKGKGIAARRRSRRNERRVGRRSRP
jgi:hypothetical protein